MSTNSEVEVLVEEFRNLYVEIEEVMERSVLDRYERWLRTALTTYGAKEYERGRKEVREIIGRHNARILNAFQLQGTIDMPMIAYDERVCLVPAIEIATKETLAALPQTDVTKN